MHFLLALLSLSLCFSLALSQIQFEDIEVLITHEIYESVQPYPSNFVSMRQIEDGWEVADEKEEVKDADEDGMGPPSFSFVRVLEERVEYVMKVS